MSEMTNRQRFDRLMSFQPVDRLPMMEWAPWWDKTLDRWRGEGLPEELTDAVDVQRHLGLDPIRHVWISHWTDRAPQPASHGAGIIADLADYEAVRPTLYGDGFDAEKLRAWAEQQRSGELLLWLTFDGFFWYPRRMLGIQRHLYAFYDQADLMDRINADLLDHQRRVLEAVLEICTPDFMTFAEDMSYNHGPMISRELCERFLAPWYRQIVPPLKAAGIRVLVDSDGDVTELVDWMLALGVEGFLPLERQAGVDVGELRRRWPKLLMLGAFDKMVMHRGERAIRQEFERLGPVAAAGGFVPSVDHQTPPGVSLQQYREYLAIFRDFCRRAAEAAGQAPA